MNSQHLPTTFTVSGLGSNGDGYIIIDDQKIFIPFTLHGDVVEAVFDVRSHTTLYNIVQFSQDRMTPACPHFTYCGGCTLQHLPENIYKDFKVNQITAPLLAHQVHISGISEPFIMGPYQRRRINLKAKHMGQYIDLGYYQFHTHRIVNVIECPVTLPIIVQIFEPLRAVLKILLKPHASAEIAITYTIAGLDMLITTSLKGALDLVQREQLIDFARAHQLARLSFNREIIVAFQTPSVNFAGVAVTVDAGSFLQASQVIDIFLEQLIDKHFADKTYKRVADLFCGRGTLSLALAKYTRVDGYEIDMQAIQALRNASTKNHIGRLHIHHRNLFDLPLSTAELAAYDCVVLNPPRAGAYMQIKQLAQSKVSEILYLSCNPQTFARDAAVLTAQNYHLTTLIPIDQFHWSPHVELWAVFNR